MERPIPTQVWITIAPEGERERTVNHKLFLTPGQASRLRQALQDEVDELRGEL